MSAMDVEDDNGAADAEDAKHAGATTQMYQGLFELSQLPEAEWRSPRASALRDEVLAEVRRSAMAPLLATLCAPARGWPDAPDAALLAQLRDANAKELARLDAAIVTAREGPQGGEVEAAEAMTKRAAYLAQIGDKDKALAAYAAIPEKQLSTGQKIDIAMASARLAFWAGDWPAARAGLKRAKDLNESGGDWDRRNRLKVYEGAFLLSQRDFAGAATLLLDSIATFTATELLSYPAFVFYCCVACVKSLERPVLKKKVIDSPDVIAVLPQLPHVEALLHGLHECRYRVFLEALAGVYPRLARDRLLARHAAYFLREMRLAGYVQFLESYRSVTVEGMARKFGVSPAFIDAELSRFVAAGRVGAKIDAVRGIVETTRPDSKNAQYHEVVKKGDVLLNQIQKLSRVTTA